MEKVISFNERARSLKESMRMQFETVSKMIEEGYEQAADYMKAAEKKTLEKRLKELSDPFSVSEDFKEQTDKLTELLGELVSAKKAAE